MLSGQILGLYFTFMLLEHWPQTNTFVWTYHSVMLFFLGSVLYICTSRTIKGVNSCSL